MSGKIIKCTEFLKTSEENYLPRGETSLEK